MFETLFLVLMLSSVAKAEMWTPDDHLKMKSVGNVQVSPDGRRVAFTVTEQILEPERSESRTHIWLARSDGSESFQLTRGEKSCTEPRWSPDGRWIAFTSARSGTNNLWRIRADGGEAEPLTNLKSGLGTFKWSNSGRWIAFTAPDDTSAEDDKKRKEKRDWQVMDDDYRFYRLWLLPVDEDTEGGRQPRLLTRQDFHLGTAFEVSGLDWSPDDRKIVFSHTPTTRMNDWTLGDISEIDVTSGEIRAVAGSPSAESMPLYSPDGRWIAYTASDVPPSWAFLRAIYLVPSGGGAPRKLAETYDRRPLLVAWTSDSRALVAQETRGTTTALYRLPLEGPATLLYAPKEGTFSGPSLNHACNMLSFSQQSSTAPPEAFVMPISGGLPLQVSQANADSPRLPLGRTAIIRWKSSGGAEIEGLLTYPVNYQEGERYPLVVVAHGGPAGVFTQTFIGGVSYYPIAAFAARGYAVLRPNVRGSSGYGKDFRYANYGDWGGKDFADLMAGVDHVIGMGVADPQRLGVAGWSYGGYMTAWTITQTRRFKAASVGAGITNLVSFTGTAHIPGFVPDYFGGEPWEKLEPYIKRSALFNVKGVSTPTLIQHGTDDDIVPMQHGQELYNALVRLGITTRMVVYPRTPHSPSEPKFLRHIMQDNLDWFGKYLGVRP